MNESIVRVAVPRPLRRGFDYAVPAGMATPPVGARVRVPFARGQVVGVVTDHRIRSEHALKPVSALLDDAPLLPRDLMDLAQWLADYYHHPLGEVYAAMLPNAARQGVAFAPRWPRAWRVATAGADVELARAPRQRAALDALRESGAPMPESELRALGFERRVLEALQRRGLARWVDTPPVYRVGASPHNLSDEQRVAADAVVGALGDHAVVALEGVTGSGKTEVYMRAIAAVLERGGQALVLVPEIALTPQALARFRARFGAAAALHSQASDRERFDTWMNCRQGIHKVLVGTRSAVFTPFARLGLIVVDEEHDDSFKQRDGLRYSARDVAVKRAQLLGVPVVLGSATPSLATLANVARRRYRHLALARRAGGAAMPALRVLDVRGQRLRDGFSDRLAAALRHHLDAGNQALVFINRRGFAPVCLCTDCGWQARCADCDARLTMHGPHAVAPAAGWEAGGEQQSKPGQGGVAGGRCAAAIDPLRHPATRLRCHHCGRSYRRPATCSDCGGEALLAVGIGTQRVESGLAERFADVPLYRIDRDTTRSPAQIERRLQALSDGRPAILVGTQMLAKGHHLPGVTLVAVLDADGGFLSPDYRGAERTAQTIIQVAGRAGRGARAGEVWIQTHHPDNPNLLALIQSGYAGFAAAELADRSDAGLPPFAAMAVVRAESVDSAAAEALLRRVVTTLRAVPESAGTIEVTGPAPSPLARRGGRHRHQCLAIAPRRRPLRAALAALAAADIRVPNVRWSIDVDPYDVF